MTKGSENGCCVFVSYGINLKSNSQVGVVDSVCSVSRRP